MKKILFAVAALLMLANGFSQTPDPSIQKIAPEIRAAFQKGEKADFLVVFKEKADLRGAQTMPTKASKADFVFERLRETARRSQAGARQLLRKQNAFFNSFYLVNAIAVEKADAALARQLAEMPEVEALSPDPWVRFPGPYAAKSSGGADRGAIEWGLERISAPAVWALGYNGQGITVGGADTGYDWMHPAIQKHYRGWAGDSTNAQNNYNWHDAIHEFNPHFYDSLSNSYGVNPCGLNALAPCDDNSHGTHTMGTMTGDDDNGNQIGVAPGAQWVGCRNMERGWGRPSTYIECFEWFLAPTDSKGLNPDPGKAPHVINNSWYCSVDEGCTDQNINETLRQAVINLKASGVVVIVSNGNFGPTCKSTTGPPAYFEESLSVGATQPNDTIAGFSSRGPVAFDGSMRLKPNVCAPGQEVRSCVPGGWYASYSGTSMAGPHVVGLVALMLSARPELAGHVEDIENIIEQSAIQEVDAGKCEDDTGSEADFPNNTYGFGRVNALAAVNQALNWKAPVSASEPATPTAAVYPNPVREEAVFDVQNLNGKAILQLRSADGKQIHAQLISASGRLLLPVSLKNLPGGVYVWQMQTAQGVVAGKLLKE